MFGGGTEFSCGEDTIFLQDCAKKGLRIYTDTTTLGTIDNGESTWFHGYTDKFFIDKGVLYKYVFGGWARLLSLYHVVKHRKKYAEVGVKKAYKLMVQGIKKKL